MEQVGLRGGDTDCILLASVILRVASNIFKRPSPCANWVKKRKMAITSSGQVTPVR